VDGHYFGPPFACFFCCLALFTTTSGGGKVLESPPPPPLFRLRLSSNFLADPKYFFESFHLNLISEFLFLFSPTQSHFFPMPGSSNTKPTNSDPFLNLFFNFFVFFRPNLPASNLSPLPYLGFFLSIINPLYLFFYSHSFLPSPF